MTLARKLAPTPPADLASQRGGVDAWDAWLYRSDDVPDATVPHYPDPTGERAATNVDRERNR